MSKGFDELTKFHSLSLMKWDEDNYASENTQLAKDFYEAGQQARQAEVDELNFQLAEMKSRLNEAYTDGQSSMYKTKQAEIDLLHKRIDDALEKCYTGIRKQGGDYYLELVEGILKGFPNNLIGF